MAARFLDWATEIKGFNEKWEEETWHGNSLVLLQVPVEYVSEDVKGVVDISF